MGMRVVDKSIVVLCLFGSESSMGWGKMRVHCRKGYLPRVHTCGVEKMEETFVRRGNIFRDIYPLFWKYSEKLLLEGETSLVVSIMGFLKERFPWKVPFFLCNRTVHFSSGVWYSWKHLFFELDVVGQVYCGNGLPCKGPFRGGEKMGESTGQRLPGKHQQFEGGEF